MFDKSQNIHINKKMLAQHHSMWASQTKSEFPLTHTCAYMTHKNIKGRTFFRAHASQGPTKTGYYPDIFATVLENPHVLHRSAILFTRSCLHRKRYLTFFSLQQRNQVKLHLPDRKESLMKILRRFRDPRNVFFLPNGLKNLHGWCMCQPKTTF